ncbi:MAG: hydantoinase B/oxoprolinase family protein, partial [Pacificimonas sp.]
FFVGPDSAGAAPGPACYRRGGPLTVTDCNLILGKLQSDRFPSVFGPGGDQPLDPVAASARMAEILDQLKVETGTCLSPEAAAEGFVAIAVANMAQAIKRISVGRGRDVTRYTLACFGGAGGQHACLVADALGMSRVMIHRHAGVLSAYGMGLAGRRASRQQTLGVALQDSSAIVSDTCAALGDEALAELGKRRDGEREPYLETRVALRHDGTDHAIEVDLASADNMAAAFHDGHRKQFGFAGSAPLIVETLRVMAVAENEAMIDAGTSNAGSGRAVAETDVNLAGAMGRIPIWQRDDIPVDVAVPGPAVILDPGSTTIVEPGWRAELDRQSNLILTRTKSAERSDASTALDPIRLEIFNGLFMAIAEEMGAALQHSASSVNIRERLDFSCALFDADGNLVANAPHMPVHLGSMGASVQAIYGKRAVDGRGIRRGDVYALNAPYDGGTHLPDITVVMPVFLEGDAPAYWVASRGHHADIGGIAPGSMPADSRTIDEEGVVFDNVLIVEGDRFRDEAVRALLTGGAHPARMPMTNIADLKAQVAACARGARELLRVTEEQGPGVVAAYMDHVQDHAEEAVRRLLMHLSDGERSFELDNGAIVACAVRIEGERATFDFTGTSDQQDNNFNAPFAVVRAAVLYAIRTLVDEAIPMNDGCLRPVDIVVPPGSMLDPQYPAAVVAGNVETSQVVCDVIFGALGAMAAAQGTMNNFTFGDGT